MRHALLCAVTFVCASHGTVSAQQDYVKLIERYTHCDDRAPYDLLEQPIASWFRQPVPLGLVGPAIVLHAHAALETHDPNIGGWHLDRAVALFDAAAGSQAAPHAPRKLYLQLYILQTAYYHVVAWPLRLRDHLERLPSDLPRGTGLLLRASASEFYNTPLVSLQVRTQLDTESGVDSRYLYLRSQDLAIQLLRDALAVAPDEAEAHVRLGRLLMVAHHADEAEAHLRRAARRDAPQVIRYWAELLLGRLLQQKSDFGAAEAAYREAVRLEPSAQSGRVALAQFLWNIGRGEEASDVVDVITATSTVRNANRDPWWDYFFGPYWRSTELLRDMQQTVRTCR